MVFPFLHHAAVPEFVFFNYSYFWNSFSTSFLLLSPKAASALTKGFLKTDSSHMNEFPKAAEMDNFSKNTGTVCIGFGNQFMGLLAAFRNPFVTALEAFEILFETPIWAWKQRRSLNAFKANLIKFKYKNHKQPHYKYRGRQLLRTFSVKNIAISHETVPFSTKVPNILVHERN